ncbi:MarR family winged helix-turn-helix transcriptional regulator [Serinicoccus profundi]|uniref:MarR family winged helix-turn-helix transcriptional regulator n=1 Tax=Serinicoccus profundi TaxID=1078471 RepID=UPI000255E31D|nr:MarR family transcriptional regulator [Serinicoccus profundi]
MTLAHDPPRAPDLLALDQQVCFALAVASRNVITLYRPFLAPLGITHPQYLVMLALWEEAPVSVVRLSQRLSLEPATLSPLLKRLETRGLITRERRPEDERTLAISLTPRGQEIRAEAERIPEGILNRLSMSLEELESLRDVLHRLIDASTRATAG